MLEPVLVRRNEHLIAEGIGWLGTVWGGTGVVVEGYWKRMRLQLHDPTVDRMGEKTERLLSSLRL